VIRKQLVEQNQVLNRSEQNKLMARKTSEVGFFEKG
jgi:hypothetical protein